MPEAAEVKIIVDGLKELLIDKIIVKVEVLGGKFNKLPIKGLEDLQTLLPVSLKQVECKGKLIYGTLTNTNKGSIYLWSSLGMSGFWTSKELKHNHFVFITDTGERIYYNDARRFGNLLFVKREELVEKLEVLGVDILGDSYPGIQDVVLEKFKRYPKRNICQALMNQEVLSGVGNYIKAEALYKAKISPWKTISELTDKQILNLYKHCSNIAKEAYLLKGNSFKSFKDVEGNTGGYSDKLIVYKRETDPHGNKIIKEETPDGRNTYWCPKVQI